MSGPPSFDGLANTGRWGHDDVRGTLNLITADAVTRGVATVRHGRVVSLARPMDPGQRIEPPSLVAHRMLYQGHEPTGALDSVEIAPHGFEVTHLDALGHSYHDGWVYNGRRAADVVTPEGLTFSDITALAGGIVTRGVLLDVAAARGVDGLLPTDVISAADFDAAERLAGVTVGSGDAVVLHSGIERQSDRDRTSGTQRTGVDASTAAWMHARDVAVYAGDCLDARPSVDAIDWPLHSIGLVGMGLVLVDAPLVGPLAAACREAGRYEFLFVCAPLPIRGATGSAVNPLAIL
jgi:kynurenine formamidase